MSPCSFVYWNVLSARNGKYRQNARSRLKNALAYCVSDEVHHHSIIEKLERMGIKASSFAQDSDFLQLHCSCSLLKRTS
jgi:hypothetical protein